MHNLCTITNFKLHESARRNYSQRRQDCVIRFVVVARLPVLSCCGAPWRKGWTHGTDKTQPFQRAVLVTLHPLTF